VRHLIEVMRQLRRSPAFTAAAILSLALGLGANAAIFTLANAILFRPIGAAHPEQLVRIASSEPGGRPGALIAPMVAQIRDEHIFSGLCGFLLPSNTVAVHERIATMSTMTMTGDCFATLGVGAFRGRVLTPADDLAGAPHVAVLSYEFWRREFAGNDAAIGEFVNIEGARYTVVGVAQPGFDGIMVGYPSKIFFPLANFEAGLAAAFPPAPIMPMEVFARLPAALSRQAVTARLEARWPSWLAASVPARLSPLQRDRYLARRLHVTDAATGVDYSLRPRFRQPLIALLAIAALVLLATCVNVANLQLARAADRSRERAVRVALGASRAALIGDAALESLVLLVAGVAAGTLVAYAADRMLVAVFTASAASFSIALMPDVRVAAFAIAIATLAFAIFGIGTAWRSSRADGVVLSGSARIIGNRGRLREAAVVVQTALTIILVAAAVMFASLLRDLRNAPLGYDADQVIAAQLTPQPGGYANGFAPAPYYRSLLEQVKAMPGVTDAAFANAIPLSSYFLSTKAGVSGNTTEVDVDQSFVTAGFFDAMGIPLIAGRSFPDGDAQRSVVISASTATALFGDTGVIGRFVRVGPSPQTQALPIAAVAADVVITNPQRANTRIVYLNQAQFGANQQEWPALIVRQRVAGAIGFEQIAAVVREAGHEYVSQIRSVDDQHAIALSQERLLASVSTAFAVIGLTLVVVGVFGVLSYTVTQRRGEIGLRLALGALRCDVAWLIVRRALLWIGAGAVIGMPAAALGAPVAARLLFGRGVDVTAAIGITAGLLLASAALAVLVPVRRAAALDPLEALRAE
jgi:predicted permease